ncbi:MAG: hypothetical protein QNJ63_01545 [Calothrix sp. MO_192.B10]|nr:hypothetical protein [Calothrix sp. MO_192.B10]
MKARDKIKKLNEEIDKLLVIHYSCENLSDDNEGYSPRITSIAVQNVDSQNTNSFSIHLIAEEEQLPRENIEQQYNQLEKKMLSKFYEFVRRHNNYNWLHWNMKTVNYGFEAIAHRYKILSSKDAPNIPESKKFNLSSLILEIYGDNCVDHPRMIELMKINGGVHRSFLSGKDEVEAFRNKEYLKLHKSTLCKVNWFRKIFTLLIEGKLKTQRSNWLHTVNKLLESLPAKNLGFVAIILTFYSTIDLIYKNYFVNFEDSKPTNIQNEKK